MSTGSNGTPREAIQTLRDCYLKLTDSTLKRGIEDLFLDYLRPLSSSEREAIRAVWTSPPDEPVGEAGASGPEPAVVNGSADHDGLASRLLSRYCTDVDLEDAAAPAAEQAVARLLDLAFTTDRIIEQAWRGLRQDAIDDLQARAPFLPPLSAEVGAQLKEPGADRLQRRVRVTGILAAALAEHSRETIARYLSQISATVAPESVRAAVSKGGRASPSACWKHYKEQVESTHVYDRDMQFHTIGAALLRDIVERLGQAGLLDAEPGAGDDGGRPA